MEQRLKNLEDLSELITKEIVQQNKSMIEMNKNLLSEIKSMREAYVKQDEDFEEFKNLLKKIYELNKQQSASHNLMPMPFPNVQHPPYSTQSSTSNQNMPPSILTNLINHPQNNLNNSFAADQVNQSMLNNVSFQSERTPLNTNQNTSSYSIPSSASAMMLQQQQQQQQFTPYMNHQLASSQQHLSSAKSTSSYQTVKVPQPQQQQPPQMLHPNMNHNVNFKTIPPQQQLQQQPQQPQMNMQQQPAKPFSFANLNKPLVSQNGTDAVKLEQQRQTFNIPPPPAQTTSTPQPSQQFPVSKFQPAADATKPKPPQFQFSPSKPQSEVSTGPKPFVQPPFVAQTAPSTTTQAPSIFGSGLFKTTTPEKKTPALVTTTSSTVPQPLFNPLISKTPTPTQPKNDEDTEEATGANPEDFEPVVDFKPLVKLQQVETKTGEEDEDVLLKLRCKLFRFDLKAKDWKEKGLGDVKFLKHKNSGIVRILMRREHVHKICANQRITPTMTIKEESPKQFSWSAIDFSDNEPKTEMLLARFKLVEEATSFKNEFLKAVEASKTLKTPVKETKAAAPVVDNKLSQLFKSDKWTCKDCYAQNNKDDLKCACCKSIKPGATAEEVSATSAPAPTSTAGGFSFGLKPDAKTQASSVKPFSFGAQPIGGGEQAKPAISFGAPQNNQPKLDFSSKLTGSPKKSESIFGSKPMPSFETLAATSTPTTSGSLFGNLGAKGAAPLGNQFGGGFKPQEAAKPLSSIFQKPQEQTQGDGEEDAVAGENPEEYEPQVDFKPIVKLTAVETKTGEEDEISVFKSRCKLYRFDKNTKEWKEKGLGDMKVLKRKDQDNMYRILMRREQVLKLCANHRITSDLTFEIHDEKQVRWHAEDYSEGSGNHELLAARFKTENEAKLFKKECENAVAILKAEPSTVKTSTEAADKKPAATEANSCANLKSTLTNMFKTDGWKCDACYAPNKASVIKCACCNTLKPGATEPEKPVEKSLVSNLGGISFGATKDAKTQPIIFGSAAPATKAGDDKTPKFDFGSKQTAAPLFGASTTSIFGAPSNTTSIFGAPSNTTSIFGAPSNTTSIFGKKSESPQKTEPASIFGVKSDVSFANLAQKTPPTGFGGGFIGGFGSLNNQAKPLFGSTLAKTNDTEADVNAEGASENPEEYEPQVDFKPLVKLQEVETKTGEEDEDVMFKNRAKLYRFNPELKEWKEKGVGDIKILKHKLRNTYRVLMRREQVLKICANHRINPSIKLEKLNEKQLTWHVQDCSEEQPRAETLLIKFRHEEEATKFRTVFTEVQRILKANPSDATESSSVKTEAVPNKIVSKVAEGSWKCDGCLSLNKPGTTKCACCETPKPSGDNDDVLLVETVEATNEQKAKARQYQLPDNFYLYEKCKDCKGCRGCEPDAKE